MKIEQHEDNATGNVFIFPNNPMTYSDKSEKNMSTKSSSTYWNYFTTGDATLKTKRNIVIKGHFTGSTKEASYSELYKEMHDDAIKRLFFSDNKFMIVMPTGLERTQTGGRSNFIDYVGNFISPFNILFGDPVKTTLATNPQLNNGDMPSPLLEVTIANLNIGDTYKIEDSQGNGFAFTSTKTGSVTIKLIYMIAVGGGYYQTWYGYAKYDSGDELFPGWANSTKTLFPRLQPGEAVDTISCLRNAGEVSETDISSDVTIKWANAYASD